MIGGPGVRTERPPALQRGLVEVEPVPVRRCRAVLEHVVERPEPAPGVVEHAIQDDPHPPGMGGVQQLPERWVPAQQRIHPEVVVRVVAMVRRRGEDRVEVERVDTQVREIRQPLRDPQQVAALEAVPGRRVVPGLHGSGLPHPSGRRESVREDLVEDGIADPVGCVDRHGPESIGERAGPGCQPSDRGPPSRGTGRRRARRHGNRRGRGGRRLAVDGRRLAATVDSRE